MNNEPTEAQVQQWWAQQLQQAYITKRKANDKMFRGLAPDWLNPAKWAKLAAKLMHCGMSPINAMDSLWQACPSKIPPPFELNIAATSPVFVGMARLNSLTEEEAQEMIAQNLNPQRFEDRDFYYLKEKIKYWLATLYRVSGTTDLTAPYFHQSLCDGLCGAPAWVCYLIGTKVEEVFRTHSEAAHKYFMDNPTVGYAAIRLGYPKEVIYPYGTPYGD